MEDEFEEFVFKPFIGDEEIELEYEFDAPHFSDLTRTETYLEALEAEQWFEYAGSYPPSPFALRLRWRNATRMDVNNSAHYSDSRSSDIIDNDSACCLDSEVSAADDDSSGVEFYNRGIQDTLTGKTESLSKSIGSRSSTLMKPTASHLAKQKCPLGVHTTQFFRSQNSSPSDGQATKRQKLEVGYLRKAAHLKHKAHFTHKTSKKADPGDPNSTSRSKANIPRPPDLETAHRAERHRSRMNSESGGNANSCSHMFKARPLNRKIFDAPPLRSHKLRTPPLTEFQEFHLKTLERAKQYTSSKAGGTSKGDSISNSETRHLRGPNSTNASKQEKCKLVNKFRGSPDSKRPPCKEERSVFRNIKQENVISMELKDTNDNASINEPPTDSFTKLSLTSDVKQTTKIQSKEQSTSKNLKENRPGSFHQEHEKKLVIEVQRHCGKFDIKSHLHVSRGLHIC